MIKIIDMGLGNINSISKCIQFLNYEFQNVRKTKFLLVVKRIDKTLKTYSLFYLTLDKVVIRIKNFCRFFIPEDIIRDFFPKFLSISY